MHAANETLIPYHRARDGELAGYLRPAAGANEDLVIPVSLLGHTLAEPSRSADAEATLEARGLDALASVWWVLAPDDLRIGDIDLRQPAPDWIWRRFVVAELTPSEARVRLHFAMPAEMSVTLPVFLPADDVLHAEPLD